MTFNASTLLNSFLLVPQSGFKFEKLIKLSLCIFLKIIFFDTKLQFFTRTVKAFNRAQIMFFSFLFFSKLLSSL